MKKEDKDLLIKYLYMALPYGVNIQVKDWTTLDTELKTGHIQRLQNEDMEIKPYLRPLKSITDEEMDAYTNTGSFLHANGIPYNLIYTTEGLLFLLNNHFDIFGLIPKCLAIEVTEENNPYKAMEE